MLAVVPEDERDWRLLGGLVEVPEDLREFDRDGRILAIQESNVVLVVILALTFADLAVTALATYPQGSPILAGNCPMIEREGDGPVDAGGNALKAGTTTGMARAATNSTVFSNPVRAARARATARSWIRLMMTLHRSTSSPSMVSGRFVISALI